MKLRKIVQMALKLVYLYKPVTHTKYFGYIQMEIVRLEGNALDNSFGKFIIEMEFTLQNQSSFFSMYRN